MIDMLWIDTYAKTEMAFGNKHVLMAEHLIIRTAMWLASQHDIQRVIIESDSQLVVNSIITKSLL